MFKRNVSSILIIIAMSLNILNFGYSNISFESTKFWITLGSIFVLIAAFVKIFITENKEKSKSNFD